MYRFIARGPALALMLLAGAAHAQEEEPRTRIEWLQNPESQNDVTTVQPFPDAPNIPSSEESPDPLESPDLEVFDETLIGIDQLPEAVANALGAGLWAGTPPAQRSKALASVELLDIHAANRLLIAILLTPADEEDLAEERARALLRVGAVPESIRVASAIKPATPDSLAILTLGSMLLGKGVDACKGIQVVHGNMLPSGAEGIFCAAVRGQNSLADVRLNLLRQSGQMDELETDLLYGLIIDQPDYASLPEDEEPAPLSDFAAAMLVHLGRELPALPDSEKQTAQLWLRTIEGTAPEEQVKALETLEAKSLVPAERLAQKYIELSEELEGSRAALARVITESEGLSNHPRFPEVLDRVLRKARDEGTEGQTARLLATVAAEVTAQPDSAKNAPAMQRILLLASKPEAARQWVPDPPTRREGMLMALAGGYEPQASGDIETFSSLDRSLRAALSALTGEPLQVSGVQALDVLIALRSSNFTPVQAAALLQNLNSAELLDAARQVAVEVVLLGD